MATKPSTEKEVKTSKAKSPRATKGNLPEKAVANKPAKGIDSMALIHGQNPYEELAGEDYMGIRQKDHFRNILHAWKKELMEEVDRTLHYMQDESANLPDPVDRASQEEEFSLELRARDRERKLIKKIDETIKRIDEDDYGYCTTCGVEIGIRRLEARPTANLCIDCKTLAEIKEKQLQG